MSTKSTKATKKAQATKPAKAAKPAKASAKQPEANGKPMAPAKMSQLDAAANVLADAGQPLNCKDMVAAMAAKQYWTSPGGKTPHATLSAAILREMTVKKTEARFKKTGRGLFTIKAR